MRISIAKRLTIGATLLLTMPLAACGGEVASQGASESTTLRLAYVYADGNPLHEAAKQFAGDVEERTDGRVKIELFPNSQLGGETEMNQAQLEGSLDMRLGGVPFDSFPALGVTMAPFNFDTPEQAVKALRSDVAYELVWEPWREQDKITTLDSWYLGQVQITSNRKFDSPDNINGLTMRTPATENFVDMVSTLGANPVPIQWPEVYTSLQTGVVDSFWNGYSLIYQGNIFEVQKYLIPMNLITQAVQVTVTDSALAKLSTEDQAILKEAALAAGNGELVAMQKAEVEWKRVIDEHLETVEGVNRDAFVTKMQAKFMPKWEKIYGAGVLEKLQEAGR